MAAQILSFFQRAPYATHDWSQQEVAEFYRVESALIQAGVQLESDRGLSDEGEPWFIFCRSDSGEVFMHFARIDGLYVVDGAAFEEPARGGDFAVLIRRLIERYPLARARERTENNVFVHPAALLIALVGAAFFHTNEAKAAEAQDGKAEPRRHASLLTISAPAASVAVSVASSQQAPEDAAQVAAILLSAVLALHEEALRLPRELALPSAFNPHVASGIAGDFVAFTIPSTLTSGVTFDPSALSLDGSSLGVADKVATHIYSLAPTQDVTATSAVAADLSVPLIMPESGGTAAPTMPAPLEVGALGAGAGKPIFIVKMSAVPVQTVEAVAVAASSQALSELIAKALPQVDRLPTTLLNLIGKGDHFDGAAPSLGPDAPPSVSETQTSPQLPKPGSSLPVASGHDPAIDAAIAQFVAQVKHLDMFMQDRQLVLVDRDIFSPFAPDLDLDSVTFTFKDGSSVSLVGTVDELRHFHWAV